MNSHLSTLLIALGILLLEVREIQHMNDARQRHDRAAASLHLRRVIAAISALFFIASVKLLF